MPDENRETTVAEFEEAFKKTGKMIRFVFIKLDGEWYDATAQDFGVCVDYRLLGTTAKRLRQDEISAVFVPRPPAPPAPAAWRMTVEPKGVGWVWRLQHPAHPRAAVVAPLPLAAELDARYDGLGFAAEQGYLVEAR